MTRAIGVDVGSKRIGLAIQSGAIATPVDVVDRRGDELQDAAVIIGIAHDRDASLAVVGLPFNMSGTRGPAVDAAEAFGAALEAAGLPVVYWDERLTSVQAERMLIDGGARRSDRKKVIDKIAATVILQAWLDAGSPGAPVG